MAEHTANQERLPKRRKENPQPLLQHADTWSYAEKSTGTAIVLFRADLRLHDHVALTHAIEEFTTVIPVYVFDTRQFGASSKEQRTYKHRAKFVIESVAMLRQRLERIGGNLVIRVGIPEQIIPELASRTRPASVFIHKEISTEDLEVEMKLMEKLKEQGIELKKFWSNTLYHDDDLPFRVSEMSDVFVGFRNAVDGNCRILDPLTAPEHIPEMPKHLELGKMPELNELDNNKAFDTTTQHTGGGGNGETIVGGEEEALRRLHSAAQCGDSGMTDTTDFVTCIGPWQSLGCLSPRTIFAEMKRAMNTSTEVMSSYMYYQLVWLDFFRFITFKYSTKRLGVER